MLDSAAVRTVVLSEVALLRWTRPCGVDWWRYLALPVDGEGGVYRGGGNAPGATTDTWLPCPVLVY